MIQKVSKCGFDVLLSCMLKNRLGFPITYIMKIIFISNKHIVKI